MGVDREKFMVEIPNKTVTWPFILLRPDFELFHLPTTIFNSIFADLGKMNITVALLLGTRIDKHMAAGRVIESAFSNR